MYACVPAQSMATATPIPKQTRCALWRLACRQAIGACARPPPFTLCTVAVRVRRCGKKLHNLRQGRLGPDVRDEAIAIVRNVLGGDTENAEILAQLEESIELSVSRHQEHGFAARHSRRLSSGPMEKDDLLARPPPVFTTAPATMPATASATASATTLLTGPSAYATAMGVTTLSTAHPQDGFGGQAQQCPAGDTARAADAAPAAAANLGYTVIGLPMDSLLIAATGAARAVEGGVGLCDVTGGITGDSERQSCPEANEATSEATAENVLSGACSPTSSASLTTTDALGVICPQRWRSDSSSGTCMMSMTFP